jgi:hypothetical protein
MAAMNWIKRAAVDRDLFQALTLNAQPTSGKAAARQTRNIELLDIDKALSEFGGVGR